MHIVCLESMEESKKCTLDELRDFLKQNYQEKFDLVMKDLTPVSTLDIKGINGRCFAKKKKFEEVFRDATSFLKEICDKLPHLSSFDFESLQMGGKKKRLLPSFDSCEPNAKRKRLDGVVEYILENVVGDVDGESGQPLSESQKMNMCYDLVLPKMISYKKNMFDRLSDAVLSSPVIAKKVAKLLASGVNDVENDLDFIAYEYITNKELGITLNKIQTVKKGQSKARRKIDLGVLGECDVPEFDITRGKANKAVQHIKATFPGGSQNICSVQILDHLFLMRHALFRLADLLKTVILSLDNDLCDKYRIWFMGPNNELLEWLYTVAFPIDGTRMPKSGVGAKGGDSQVTLVLAQILNYPLSIGKTASNYLLAILNCAETKVYLKIFLVFLKREAQAILDEKLEITFRDGVTRLVTFRFRGKGDLKWHNVAQSCGPQSCDIALSGFMVSMAFLQLTWFVKIEKRTVNQCFEFSRDITEINTHTNEHHTMRYLCAHMPTVELAEELCNTNHLLLWNLKVNNSLRTSEKPDIEFVRKQAYERGNNFVSTLGFKAFEDAVKNGCRFNAPSSLYTLGDPTTDSQTALEILGICHPIYSVTFDALHLNMNKQNRALKKVNVSAETRSLAQGATQHEFTVHCEIGKKTVSSTFCAFDFWNLPDHIVLKKVITAIKLASPAIGKKLIAFHDPNKSPEERTKAGKRDPNGKEASRFIRKSSLITKALCFEGESENMKEVRIATHLYMHLAKATGEKHMKYLFKIFHDELILESIGITFHKLCVIYGFGCPPNSFAHMRGLPAQLKDDRTDLRVSETEALGPAVSSSAQSSEGCNFRFREFFDNWSNKGPDAFAQVAVTYLFVYVLGKAFIKPRTEEEMGSLNGSSVLSKMRMLDEKTVFFPRMNPDMNPSCIGPKMTREQQTLLCYIHGVGSDSQWAFCESCADYFPLDESHAISSNLSLHQKVSYVVEEARKLAFLNVAVVDFGWVFPGALENVQLKDMDPRSGCESIVLMPFLTVLEAAHFFLDKIGCDQCTHSFILFMSLWRNKPLQYLFPFVSEARQKTFEEQVRIARDISTMVTVDIAEGATPTEFLKEVHEKRKVVQKDVKNIMPPELQSSKVPSQGLLLCKKKRQPRRKSKSGRECL